MISHSYSPSAILLHKRYHTGFSAQKILTVPALPNNIPLFAKVHDGLCKDLGTYHQLIHNREAARSVFTNLESPGT